MTGEKNLMQVLAHAIKEVAAKLLEQTLNDIYAAGPVAVHTLIEFRVPLDDRKMETDTRAIPFSLTPESPQFIGPLGVMNAIAGLHGLRIIGVYADAGELTGFKVEVLNDGDAAVEKCDGPELREATSGAEGPLQEPVRGETERGPDGVVPA